LGAEHGTFRTPLHQLYFKSHRVIVATEEPLTMSTQKSIEPLVATESERSARLRSQYGSEAIGLMGPLDKIYERHLVFDDIVEHKVASRARCGISCLSDG
jgi:hypothetical protein